MSMTPDQTVPKPAPLQSEAAFQAEAPYRSEAASSRPEGSVPAHAAPSGADSAEVLRKRVFTGFAGIVAAGLAIAGLYIGGRLFARPQTPRKPLMVATVAHPAPPPALPKPSPLQPTLRVPEKAAAEPVSASAPAAAKPGLISPKPGERYLQLAALSAEYSDRYVKELQTKGIHASVAPGPNEVLYRVVLGPFSDRNEIERQRDLLDAVGIQWMERTY